MAVTAQEILKQLATVTQTTSESDLRSLVRNIADNQTDSALQSYFQQLLNRPGKETAYQLNVLSGGLFGLLPGHATLTPENGKVNSFLHKLRKSIIGTDSLAKKMQDNATHFIFYPEFVTSYPALRQRIAAIALAHAGMGKSSDELSVLYSLGGYFSEGVACEWPKKIGPNAGTTCVMTVRGIYQAAGAQMIGQRVPVVTTPAGPVAELGVPATKMNRENKPYAVTTVGREGMAPADAGSKPQLQVGDIYMVEGDAQHQFLLRGGGALAPHVGIITQAGAGDQYTTVDGGQADGGNVDVHPNRKLEHLDTGWTFSDQAKSFSADDLAKVKAEMRKYDMEAQIDAYIAATEPKLSKSLEPMKPQYDDQLKAGNARMAMMILTQMNSIREMVRRRIQLAAAGPLGAKRVIHGWWKPESYGQMTVVGPDALRTRLGKAA